MSNKNPPIVKLVTIDRLKAHEAISQTRGRQVLRQLVRAQCFTKPILVDKQTSMIIDGHHRSYLIKKLGYKKIPALLLDYFSRQITVTSRRPEYKVDKKSIITRAKQQRPFPYKTTKHSLAYPLPKIKVNFNELS